MKQWSKEHLGKVFRQISSRYIHWFCQTCQATHPIQNGEKFKLKEIYPIGITSTLIHIESNHEFHYMPYTGTSIDWELVGTLTKETFDPKLNCSICNTKLQFKNLADYCPTCDKVY